MKQWFSVTARAGDDGAKRVGQVSVHGPIADSDFWGEKVAKATDFIDALKDLGEVDEIELSIHSPGGMVTEGWAIYNALKGHKARVTARVEGMAASMASVIAMAADSIEMPRNAYLMIHNVSGGAYGNIKDLEGAARTMQQLQDDITRTYTERTGMEFDAVAKLMEEETWMNGERAHELGFADFVLDEVKAAAVSRADLTAFAKVGTSVPVQLAMNAVDDAEAAPPEDAAEEVNLEEAGGDAEASSEVEPEAGAGEDPVSAEEAGAVDPAGDAGAAPEEDEAEAEAGPEDSGEAANRAEGLGLRALVSRVRQVIGGGGSDAAAASAAADGVTALEQRLSALESDLEAERAQVTALDSQLGEAERLIVACLEAGAPEVLAAMDPEERSVLDLVKALTSEVKQIQVCVAETLAEMGWSGASSDDLPGPVSAEEAADGPEPITVSDYNAMSAKERREFLNDGGKVIPDAA